jgi:hypothetical protein
MASFNTKKSGSPEPSHMATGLYVTLMETNDKECESWYYFIRKSGNDVALHHLQKQLNDVRWRSAENLSTFDLDLDHPVSAKTAKQITKLELNVYFNRKFDGKLKTIDLGFRSRDDNDKKMCKTFDLLGYGQIEDYINDEDVDPEDLIDTERQHSSSESDSDSDSDSGDDSDKSESKSSYRSRSRSDSHSGSESGIPPSLKQ